MAEDEKLEADMASVDRKVWIIKVPKVVADAWGTASEGTVLGELALKEGIVTLDPELVSGVRSAGKQIGEVLSFKEFKDLRRKQEWHPFFEIPQEGFQSKRVKIAGTVDRHLQCTLRPEDMATVVPGNYNQFAYLARDTTTAATKQRTYDVLSKAPRKQKVEKNIAMPIDQLRDKLLEEFAKHEWYSVDDLMTLTRQPRGHLMKALQEIAELGTNEKRFRWHLKAEYRTIT